MIPSKTIGSFYPYWTFLKRMLRGKSTRPMILDQFPQSANNDHPITFVMIVSPEFDQRVPNASRMARLGWCNGFNKIGIPYRIVSILDLYQHLPSFHQPICWITESDYRYLTSKNLKILKKTTHIVWVNPWFQGEKKFYMENQFADLSSPEWIRQRVLNSQPSFVFTTSPSSSFEFYEGWMKHGVRLFSFPLAWDEIAYPENPVYDPEFENIALAFVGGYWKYKARQLDRYLSKYENNLTVFGYTEWPYGKYGGLLPIEREASLYRQAKVSPVINEPHVEVMNVDQNERVFKVLGSGGFAVTDAVPSYREWFSEDELPIPKNEAEFHEIVHLALEDSDFNFRFRKAGHRAVIERHRYSCRAEEVLKALNIHVK